MSLQGEEVHHVGQLGGDLDEGHGGRRQDDVVHLLGLELVGEEDQGRGGRPRGQERRDRDPVEGRHHRQVRRQGAVQTHRLQGRE